MSLTKEEIIESGWILHYEGILDRVFFHSKNAYIRLTMWVDENGKHRSGVMDKHISGDTLAKYDGPIESVKDLSFIFKIMDAWVDGTFEFTAKRILK